MGPPQLHSRSSPRFLVALALVLALVIPLLGTDAPQDDAYITYRYAEHFVQGHGLVFNVGEEPVEGYTNFLWTVLIAGGMQLGLDPEVLGPWLGLFFTLLATVLCGLLARALGAKPVFAAAAMVLFALQPTLRVHATGGLETSMFTVLLVAALLPRMHGPSRSTAANVGSGFLWAAAALTRPEGVMVFGLLELADAARSRIQRLSLREWLQGALQRGLPFILVVGTHALWRHATYEAWVPNTFHAKVASDLTIQLEGLRYVGRAMFSFGLPLIIAPYFLGLLSPNRSKTFTVLWVTTLFASYVIYVGGDYMPTFRFLLPIFPLWSALAGASFSWAHTYASTAKTRGRIKGVFVLLLVASAGLAQSHADFWPDQVDRHADLVAVGKQLNECLPEDAWIAATAAGRVPFFSKRRCIDMMGLSDRHIAQVDAKPEMSGDLEGHLKGDGHYVLGRAPEVILFLRLMATPKRLDQNKNWKNLARKQAFSISEIEIAHAPEFYAEYKPYSLPLTGRSGFLNMFVRAGVMP